MAAICQVDSTFHPFACNWLLGSIVEPLPYVCCKLFSVDQDERHFTESRNWQDVDGQAEHKLAYFADHLPPSCRRIILIGHSIGCYIILKMLTSGFSSSSVNGRTTHREVLQSCLLFPTIERMAGSPQGRIATPLLRYFRWMVPILMYPLCFIIPDSVKRFIISWHLGVSDSADPTSKHVYICAIILV